MRLRDFVPPRHRASARALLGDLPFRMRDLPADMGQLLGVSGGVKIPAPHLRHKVGANSSRKEFLRIGKQCADDILAAYAQEERVGLDPGAWLDFGCGCGRVARYLIASPTVDSFTGVDVDPRLIGWVSENLPGTWLATSPRPPLPFASDGFDVIVSVSVFTHLPEDAQFSWLRELRRILRPGGLLVVSTHPPVHAAHLPEPFALDPAKVETEGFAHVSSIGPFNHQSSFHSLSYLRSAWTKDFELLRHLPHGLAGYQDLSIWAVRPIERSPRAGSSVQPV